MKHFNFLLIVVISMLFASCGGSRSGKLHQEKVQQLQKQKEQRMKDSLSVLKENTDRFKEQLILQGVIFLDGKVGGETSPRIIYGVLKNSDYFVSLVLMQSASIPDAPNGNGIPIDVAMKVKDIVKKKSLVEHFYFETGNEGYIYYGFLSTIRDKNVNAIDALDESLKVLSAIEKETGWKVTKGSWKTPRN